ncbi:MAG TPA: sulfotransferase [Steroidobacteraceae bacterium]|nr:sulfotransferase [Steroidobacteraceae bacterium]
MTASSQEMLAVAAALDSEGRVPEAIAAYERLLEFWPGQPDCWYNLARLQRQTGRYTQALASYQEALERHVTRPEEVHLNRGVIFSDCLNQYDAAERELKKALAINPVYVPALINYANLHEDLGRRELAASMYERLLALEPDSPSALARYSQLKDFTDIDDPLIGRLRAALNYPGISPATQANVEFSLGRALDACGAYDAAFQVYRQANRHSRENAPPGTSYYDLALEEKYTDRLIEVFAQGLPRAPQPRATQPRPVFICGMFRSGSTLLEQLLAGHPSITAGGELDFIPRAVNTVLAPFPDSFDSIPAEQLSRLAADYRAMLVERFPEAINVTDKRPDNFLYIGLIKALFPQAKIVHTVRDALDNCLSIYFLHLDPAMSYALDLMDIGHHYRQYVRLMSHWKRLFGADILDVSYDSLLRDQKSQLEQVLAFLGLDWDEGCASVGPGRAVKTASVWQVREPLYTRSSGRSRHYAKQLEDLRKYIEFPM